MGPVCDQSVKNRGEPGQAIQSNLMCYVGVLDKVLCRDDRQVIGPTLVVVERFILDHGSIERFNQIAIGGPSQNQKALNIEKEFLFIGYFMHVEFYS